MPDLGNVDRGEDALVGQAAVEDQLHVAGALELLEDHRVHDRAGVDQGGGEDGQAAAVFDVAGRAEELLGLDQGAGFDAAGHDAAAGGRLGVVGTTKAGDRVEQDDHVLAALDQALGLVDGHLGDLHVTRPAGRRSRR